MKLVFFSLCLCFTHALGAQSCDSTYGTFNRMMESHYLGGEVPEANLWKKMDFSCFGCSSVDQLFGIYADDMPEDLVPQILEVVSRGKCRQVGNKDLQAVIDQRDSLFARTEADFLSKYLLEYEQLIRSEAEDEVISRSDGISYEMLMDVLEGNGSAILPVLLHGSDKLPEEEIPAFEDKLLGLVMNGGLNPGAGAAIMDRIYFTRFGYQKYGSAVVYDEFLPIMNPVLVDEYRKRIGLYPLEIKIRWQDLRRPVDYTYVP